MLDPKGQQDQLSLDFQEVATEFAIKKAQADPATQLLTKQARIEQYKLAYEKEFAAYRKQLERGARAIFNELVETPQELLDAIKRMGDVTDEQLASNRSLQELAGVDDTVLDALYQGAKKLYEKESLDEAVDAFTFLLAINEEQYIFWRGLGSAEFKRKEFKKAAAAFTKVSLLAPNDQASRLLLSVEQ